MTQHLDLDALRAKAKAAGIAEWRAIYEGGGDHLVLSAAGDEIAICEGGNSLSRGSSFDTAAAKAAFIAAANPAVVDALIDRLRKAEAASMPGHVIVPAEQFLAVLDRSDWRTAKNRAELRAMIAAPDSTEKPGEK